MGRGETVTQPPSGEQSTGLTSRPGAQHRSARGRQERLGNRGWWGQAAGGEGAEVGTYSRVGSRRILHLFLKGWDVIKGI